MLLCGEAQNGFAGSTSESGGLQMAVNEVQLHTAALRNLFAFQQILFRSRKMRCPAAARGAGKQSERQIIFITRFTQAINRLIEPFNGSADRFSVSDDTFHGSVNTFNVFADTFILSVDTLNAVQVRCNAGNGRQVSLRNCFLHSSAA